MKNFIKNGKKMKELEKKILEAILNNEDLYYFIRDNIKQLQENKDYFRKYFLKNPKDAYRYALDVDKKPREDTRKAACKDPFYAYCYALYIDKKPREDTRKVACKNSEYKKLYKEWEENERIREETS